MKKYNSFLGAFFSGDNGDGGYNAAYKKSALAKLYSSQDPAEQQMASEGLARVDPEAAGKWQQEQVALRQEGLKRKATMIANAPPAQRGQLYSAVLPDIRKDWAEAPEQYTPELDQMVTAWAQSVGGGSQTGDTRWIQTTDENGKPVWAAANNRGINPTKYGVPTSYKLEDDPATGNKFKFNNKTGQLEPVDGGIEQPAPTSGGIIFPEDIPQAANSTAQKMQQVRAEIARRVQSGVPVQLATQQVMAEAMKVYGLGATGQQPARAPSGYVGLSAAEKARLEAQAKAEVDLNMQPQIEGRKAESKAIVEGRYAPQIAGASAEATAQGKARGERTATGEKKFAEASDAIELLKEAEQLLADATGGYVGAKADEFAAAFGRSTKGAEANAQLNVIAPKLIGLVPRFEGPQSDADRKLYESAAGDLGNPNKPVSTRLAAARIMMKLYQRTADGKKSADGQPKRIRITL